MDASQKGNGIQNLREFLQVRRESAVVLGNDLDFDRFTPDQLVSYHVVPEDWDCWRFERFSDATRIQYEGLNFRMTEGQLWISDWPDFSLAELLKRGENSAVWRAAEAYIRNARYAPISGFWAHWTFAIDLGPPGFQWLVENFTPDWPSNEKRFSEVQTAFTCEQGGNRIRLEIRNERQQETPRRDWPIVELNCYVYPPSFMGRSTAIVECARWSDRLVLLDEVITGILSGQEENHAS